MCSVPSRPLLHRTTATDDGGSVAVLQYQNSKMDL